MNPFDAQRILLLRCILDNVQRREYRTTKALERLRLEHQNYREGLETIIKQFYDKTLTAAECATRMVELAHEALTTTGVKSSGYSRSHQHDASADDRSGLFAPRLLRENERPG